MSKIGDNNPPTMAITAGEVAKDLSGWMSEHPVIETDDQAREAKVYIDRAALCEQDLEAERKSKTAPLNEQVKVINDYYRAPRELLKGVCDELKRRFDTFLLREEAKRVAAAQDAARRAAEAERAAREAENRERQTLEEADAGVAGLDIAARTAEADQAFSAYQKSARQAEIAERETRVKIGGGFRRALSLKIKEELFVINAGLALTAMGPNEDIAEALIKSARAYRKLHGHLPAGIGTRTERKS